MRNRYNQAPNLTQDTKEKQTPSQLDNTNESEEVSPFPAGDHMASINRRARNHNKNKTEITYMIYKKSALGTVNNNILLEGLNRLQGVPTSPLVWMWIKTHRCLVCKKDP